MSNLIRNDIAMDLERAMLDMPNFDLPVAHHFGPGIYIREVFIPKGAVAVGHHHRTEHLTIVLSGRIAIVTESASNIIQGPATFLSGRGKKAVYALTDCVVQNVIATDKTDVDEIEAEFIEKSDEWKRAKAEGKLETML